MTELARASADPASADPASAGPHSAGPASEAPVSEGAAPAGGVRAAEAGRDQGRFIARAAAATAALTVAGALMGLVRDQTIAHLYGAGAATDAFLVSWTVPEIAATLLIEDAMALVLIPAFSLALSRRAALRAARPAGEDPADTAQDDGSDPVRVLLAHSLPRLLAALACASALLMVTAPWLVRMLAPGLANPQLAVECTRLTAITLLTFGTAGYLSAGLRAHRRFVPPAGIYVAYNVGIVGTVLVLHSLWGVRAAAAGVAAGGLLMVLVQLPFFLRQMPRRRRRLRGAAPRGGRRAGRSSGSSRPARTAVLAGAGVLAPIALFTLSRQSQVLVERYLASSLPVGAISHLNYAQKVAQIPMVLSLMICTVTFPLVARAFADGEAEQVRRRVERDLAGAAFVVLLGAAYVFACAPQIIELLFQRGAFTAQDTAATASVMRVYALGLLGHSLVGAVVRPYFSTGRPTWYPALAMAAGLTLTVGGGVLLSRPWGTHGIAAANAAGITLTAALLLAGTARRSPRHAAVAVELGGVLLGLLRLVVAATAAAAAGWAVAPLCGPPLLAAAVGALVVPLVFLAAGYAAGAQEVPQLLSAVERRLRHDR